MHPNHVAQHTQRFTLVDGLRGIAAMAVVLFHLIMNGEMDRSAEALPILRNGSLGVAVFFVLSGFVIAHSLYGKTVTASLAGRFMLRRAIRLDPTYWAGMLLAMAFAYAVSRMGGVREPVAFTAGQIAAHLVYAQELLGFPEINIVFWTLCLEVQFYLLYVLLLALGHHRIVLASAFLLSLPWAFGAPAPHGLFLPLWHGFLVGVAAYWAWKDRSMRVVGLIYGLAVVAAGVYRGDLFAPVCAGTAALLWISTQRGFITTALNWRWLQFLGAISYSLYITHFYLQDAVLRVGFRLTGSGLGWEVVWGAVAIAASVAGGYVLWWLVERPSMKLAKRVALIRPPKR